MEKKGRYGEFGGQYAAETLMNALINLEEAFNKYKDDEDFNRELNYYHKQYTGRPSILYYAEKMTKDLGGAKIYLKREDLNHTGAHKINNVIGQCLLAKRMGKKKVIAETGAGQHGVATATFAAVLGLECDVYMGEEDTKRQALNVFRMNLLGATVHPITSGTGTLKDATNEAMRAWTANAEDTFYVLGSAVGPHPYPLIVKHFQSVISKETRKQLLEMEGKLPEAAGDGVDTERHAASITKGTVGVLHGMKSLFLQDNGGNIMPVYSISAGLDYPGIGPEHAYMAKTGRAEYYPITDKEAVDSFVYLSRMEGIIPAIESSHAIALARKIAPTMKKDEILVVCLSGRGDKDVYSVAKYLGKDISEE